MNQLKQWEEEIVELLRKQIPEVSTIPYPNNPKNYFVKHSVGEILVRYDGGTFAINDVGNGFLDRNVTYELILVFRELRLLTRSAPSGVANETSLYEVSEKMKSVLFGYKLKNAISGIMIEREDLIGEEEGLWSFGMKIQFKAILENKNNVDEYGS